MLKKIMILTTTICAAASMSISQTAYAQINELKITASDNAACDRFGNSVSVSGDYAIVGTWSDDDNGDNSGSVFCPANDGL